MGVDQNSERAAALASDAAPKRLQRRVEIDAVLHGPVSNVIVTRLLTRAAKQPEAFAEFNIVAERAPLPAVRVVIPVTHDCRDHPLIVQQSPRI